MNSIVVNSAENKDISGVMRIVKRMESLAPYRATQLMVVDIPVSGF